MRIRSAILTATLVAACGAPNADAPPASDSLPGASPEDTTPTAAAPSSGLTDAQIVDVLAASNQVDARSGELALASGSDARVRQYGQRLTVDHTGANRAGAELASRLGIVAEPNPISARFRDDAERSRSVMERESGAEFDRVFLENEVEYHTMMLQALDGTLLPAVRNPELRSHIQGIRPVVEAHLQQARQLQAALAGG